MHPLFHLPGFDVTLPAYHTLILLAAAVCLAIGPRWAQRLEGIEPRTTLKALAFLGAAAFIGGRLHFVVNQWGLFAPRPLDALKVWSGGLHAGGAIVGIVVAGWWIGRRGPIRLAPLADGIAPTVGVGIAIARLGCFLQGCCFGSVCAWPWCISFPRNTYIYEYHESLSVLPPGASETAPIHPLQLYFAAAGLAVTAVALWVHGHKRFDGQVALAALLMHSISAAVLELLRADYYPRAYWGPLPQLEWMALAMTVAAAAALIFAHVRAGRGRAATLNQAARG